MNTYVLSPAVISSILGLAVGDALGVPVEFDSRSALAEAPVTGMRGGGSYGQPPGTWSDDSSMTLCTLDSLCSGLDYEDMMKKFLSWADDGLWTAHGEVFDMGIATRKALIRYAQGSDALSCGGTGFHDNGNGSLMRILPVALYLYKVWGPGFNRRPEAYDIIHRVSSLTHAHPISLVGCGIYCSIACELLSEPDNAVEAVRRGIQVSKDFYRHSPAFAWVLPSYRRVNADTLLSMKEDDVDSSGYVVSTLEAALWCLLHTGDYSTCVLRAVNLGDDTDTVAAVSGGLAGIRYGLSSIPSDWLSVLARREEIDDLCSRFNEEVI